MNLRVFSTCYYIFPGIKFAAKTAFLRKKEIDDKEYYRNTMQQLIYEIKRECYKLSSSKYINRHIRKDVRHNDIPLR